ncbi:hypothetical protein Glove_99g192 [Diversispora epigaea]|uniref:Uncharacterized protein n=1 Tax=Diversispora epigaea TaxID=1348612 RepID=A0A397J478_9GLOM|nr:hypothetical protein Glove_99g280 [Diversispora epigaea]RHZ83211.1 hypothetical protein Glove_99g192 [Diversispora epigaea]
MLYKEYKEFIIFLHAKFEKMIYFKSTTVLISFIILLSSFLFTIHASKECPLSSKCPYYKAYHSPDTNLKNYNWDETNCPAANKCPYFEKIKKRVANDESIFKEGGCPYVQNCPHAKSDHKRTDDDISKCPHLNNKIKNCPYIKNNNASPPGHYEL